MYHTRICHSILMCVLDFYEYPCIIQGYVIVDKCVSLSFISMYHTRICHCMCVSLTFMSIHVSYKDMS